MFRYLTALSGLLLFGFVCLSQDTLPKFTVVNKANNRILISWTNPYGTNIRQLTIQRSFDSLKNYKSILTLPDPTPPQNGYVDNQAVNDHMFYRLYIQLDSGKYLFSKGKRPAPDTAQTTWTGQTVIPEGIEKEELNKLKQDLSKAGIKRILIIKKGNEVVGAIPESDYKLYRDSVKFNTSDTLVMSGSDTVVIKPFIPKVFYTASKYVFTANDGNVKIFLEEAATKKYSVKFFEEDNTEVFEIRHIAEPVIIVDKTNFYHSGWFNFELYEDGKLKEKHKLFIPKDF